MDPRKSTNIPTISEPYHHQTSSFQQSAAAAVSADTNVIPNINLNTEPPLSQRAACATTDFAMQNVLLQMNLIVLSVDDGMRIRRLKSWVLRCGACFKIHSSPEDQGFMDGRMKRLFCSQCGSDLLQRIAASVDGKTGRFKLHFRNADRGNIYCRPGGLNIPYPNQVEPTNTKVNCCYEKTSCLRDHGIKKSRFGLVMPIKHPIPNLSLVVIWPRQWGVMLPKAVVTVKQPEDRLEVPLGLVVQAMVVVFLLMISVWALEYGIIPMQPREGNDEEKRKSPQIVPVV